MTNAQGAPVIGATVYLPSLNVGTTTSMTGTYSLSVAEGRATGQQVALSVRFIGYRPQTRQITLTPGTHEQNFNLESDPFRLEEVVVTGVAEATSTRKLTFSVGQVSEEQIKEVPATSPITALAGKVSGVRVASGLGSPGSAPTIRLRGSTNLGVGQSAPLIIVDGVITRNSIADISANDIESVEVLKGAAASAFYGSDAANGVINVTTKRGRNLEEGRVSFTLRSEYGQSGVVRYPSLNRSHPWETNADGSIRLDNTGAPILTADQIADTPYPSGGPERWRNQLKEWLTDGAFHNVNLQMGLRRGNTNFNSSFTSDHNQGILPMTTGALRRNVRLNIDQGIGRSADFSASVTYGLTTNDYDPGGGTGTFFNLLQAPPDVDLRNPNPTASDVPFYPGLVSTKNPSARSNPLYQLANEDFFQRRERILGSFSARYRPAQWLRLDASYGTDRLNRLDRTYRFRGYLGEQGQETPGFLDRETRNNVADNAQISATATRMWFGNLLTTTRAAYLVESSRTSFFGAEGNQLNVTDVPDLAAIDPDATDINSTETLARTINYMASQAFDYRDRYLVDLLYRRDGSSLFGPNQRWKDFYRVSGAYRITEDFPIRGVQELKIRAARGTAGLRPNFLDQYETYDVDDGQISKEQLGNENLKPAIQTENEFGVNATFLDRFDLEVVYADRKTRDAFLTVPLSLAQSGGFTSQVQNAADIGANTWELSFQTRVIERPNFSYGFSLTGDRTRQKILKMNRAPFRPTFTGQGQGQNVFYYKEGEPLGIIYGTRWVRSFEELTQNPDFASANPNDYVINPAGFLVLRSQRGLPTERPIQFVATEVDPATGQTVRVRQFKIGDVNPDFAFGWANNVRWGNFGVYVLFDGQKGGDIYNFSKQWMFQDWRHGDIDQSDVRNQEDKIALPFFASGLYNGLEANDYFVEDASYVKLREFSVSYTLGRPLLGRLGLTRFANGARVALIGRNLHTWTSYSGFDPEVTSGEDFNYRIEGFRYPNFRTITGQVEIQF